MEYIKVLNARLNSPTHRRTRWRRACFARHYNYTQNALNQLASITQPSTPSSAANYGLGSCADASLIADLGNGSTGPSVAIPSAGTAGTVTTGGAQSPKYTFTHDAEGRMTQKGTQAYVYDALNRMAQVTGKESYIYDGHGRRVQTTKTSDGKINYPIYGLDGKLLVEDNRQTLQRIEYIYAGGRLVAKKIQPITAAGANNGTATTTTIHTDFLGSPVAETNSAGTVTRVERYTPYGEPSDMQLDAGPGFTGHATDVQTGLTYMQQRYMDQELGRFLTPDPVGPEEDFIKHFNRYNYAQNNPVRYTDPDGRAPMCRINPCDSRIDNIRAELARNAIDALKKREPYGLYDKNGNFQPGTYKCNLFVCNVANKSGANVGFNKDSNGNKWPPTAGNWADANAKIRGWKVVENPQLGDVVAQKRGYRDASGHVGIIVDKNLNVISARDNGLSIDKLEVLFPSNYRNGDIETGPIVYRRYIGEGE